MMAFQRLNGITGTRGDLIMFQVGCARRMVSTCYRVRIRSAAKRLLFARYLFDLFTRM